MSSKPRSTSATIAAPWASTPTTRSPFRRRPRRPMPTSTPTSPAASRSFPSARSSSSGGMTFEGQNGNDGSLYNTPKNNFMPRAGLAYQLDSKTVFRAGAGMFAGFLGQRRGDVVQNGFTQNTNMVLTNDNGLHFLTNLANPFPNGVAERGGRRRRSADLPGTGLHLLQPEPQAPHHHPLASRPAASVQGVPAGTELRGQQEQSPGSHAQHQRPAAPVPEHAADARRYLQQPADRQHRQPAVQPGARQQPGHLHRHHHLAADPAFALSGIRFQRHQHHRVHRLFVVSQRPVHAHQALLQGLHRHRQLHLLEVAAGRQSAECLRPRAASRNLGLRRAAPHQHLERLVPAVRQGPGASCTIPTAS